MKTFLPLRPLCTFALGLCALGLQSACRESEQENKNRLAQFTTSTKPPPNPHRESLEDLVRQDKLEDYQAKGLPRFQPFSSYEGQDIRQVTEVSGRSLLICFTAPWCPFSKKMSEALQNLAQQEQGKLQVVTIDADAYADLANRYQIKKVPTTILYVEGIQLRQLEGAYTTESLANYLQQTLSIQQSN